MAKKPKKAGGSFMRVRVRVKANALRESVERVGASFLVSVREPPQGNRANLRVREILARELMLPLAAVQVVAGHHKPQKTVEILDIL